MNEDTKKLLEECNSGCKMAIDSMDQVLAYVEDEALGKVIHDYKKKHEKLEAESQSALEEAGHREKAPKAIASAFSWITTEVKMMIEDDNHQIAKMMMDGCQMGIQSISENNNKYLAAQKDAKELAKRLVTLEEDFIKELEAFV